jgi:hypothetical protein
MTTLLVGAITTPAGTRNNYSGGIGLSFAITESIIVTSLGRAFFTGNSGSGIVGLLNSSGTEIVRATIDLSGGADRTFNYTAISPTTLDPGSYFLLSAEVSGGNLWADTYFGTDYTVSIGTYSGRALSGYSSGSFAGAMTIDNAMPYVPVNLIYDLPGASGVFSTGAAMLFSAKRRRL